MGVLTILAISIFLTGSSAVSLISRKSLRHPTSHGFYRFLAWEALLLVFALNFDGWFRNPFAWHQLVSWVLLTISILLVLSGLKLLREIGSQDTTRNDPSLLGMEKTAALVTSGLYGYIRHPLYSSLLFLGWGMYFKSPSWLDFGLVLLATFFLIRTARSEERENVEYFGDPYRQYMMRTKMFVPYLY